MQFYIKSAIFFCCVLGYPIPLTPLTKLVEEGVNVEEAKQCAMIYENADLTGWKVPAMDGQKSDIWNVADIVANDAASSVRTEPGCKIELFDHGTWGGSSVECDNEGGSTPKDCNLGHLDNRMSSFKCHCIAIAISNPCSSLTSCTDCSTEQDSGGEFICLFSDSGCEVSRTALYQGSGYVFDAADCPGATVTGLVDECADASLNDCDSNARCTDTAGGYSCSCNAGYDTPSDELEGHVCIDVNECDNDRGIDHGGNNCANHATCTNTDYNPDTEKGFTCTCDRKEGYHGNGTSCSDQPLYVIGDSCGFRGCACPAHYRTMPNDGSAASKLACEEAAKAIPYTDDDIELDDEVSLWDTLFIPEDGKIIVKTSSRSGRPRGCYHSCTYGGQGGTLFVGKKVGLPSFYNTDNKKPVLGQCSSYDRLHICQSVFL